MRFGIGQFTLQIPPWDGRTPERVYADTLDLAAEADRAGIDSFWLAEHHGASDDYNPALLPFLAAVAARTQRIEIGTAVLLAPLHDPLRVAEDAAVVDNISGGRLNLGLGLGWVAEEYRMFGRDFKGRGRRLSEFVEVVRAAWTQERFTHRGKVFDFEDVSVRPKPARQPHPPIYLGGAAPAAVERAARLGDGHFPASVSSLEDTFTRAREIVKLREELGTDRPYRFGMFVPVGIGSDPDDGWAKVRDGVLHVRGSYALWGQGERDVSGARDFAAQFEDAIRAGSACGTPEQIAERLRPMRDEIDGLGFEETFCSAIIAPPGTSRAQAEENLGRYASEVVPLLRG